MNATQKALISRDALAIGALIGAADQIGDDRDVIFQEAINEVQTGLRTCLHVSHCLEEFRYEMTQLLEYAYDIYGENKAAAVFFNDVAVVVSGEVD